MEATYIDNALRGTRPQWYISALDSEKTSYLPRDVTEDQEALEPLFHVCIAQRCMNNANFLRKCGSFNF